jgi:hypothetical protein
MKFQRMTIWGPKSKHKVEKEKDKERTLYSLDLKAKECGNKIGVQHLYPEITEF